MPYPAKLSPDAIVLAALDLLDTQGLAALGMRSVAERLDVRPSSLYKHCAGLPALHALLAELVAAELRVRLEEGAARAADPFEGTCHAYLAYAAEHPARYAVLLSPAAGADRSVPGTERKALWNTLLAVVGARTGDGDDTGGAVAVWSFLHGFALLRAAGAFGASGPRDGLARGLAAFARGL